MRKPVSLFFFSFFSLKSLFKKLVQIESRANFIRDYTAKVLSTVPTPQASSNVFKSRFSKPVVARNDKAASNCAVVLTCKHNLSERGNISNVKFHLNP